MATYAVGDIQGCMSSLERLLALIDYQPARDDLWLVGDLVNRGPRSLDVLRWASRQDSAVVVLGNHDLHLLRRVAGAAGAKKRDTLDDVLAAPDRDRLVDWLRRQALVHVTTEHVMVHGGLHPRWTAAKARALAAEIEDGLQGAGWKRWVGMLEGEPPRWREELAGSARANAVLAYLVRARTLWADGSINADFDGAPGEAPPGALPWFAMPDPAWADHVAVFGHWAALGLDIGPRHLGLDSGCVWGKSLTAVRLDDRAVFQVKAVESAT